MSLVFSSEESLESYLHEEMKSGYNPISDEHIDGVIRQFDTVSYGIIDLICYSKPRFLDGELMAEPSLTVIELKNEPINNSAVAQIARYKRFFERAADDSLLNIPEDCISYVLVGPDIVRGTDTCYLTDSMDWLTTIIFKLNPRNGITFEESRGWTRTKEDFSSVSNINNLLEPEYSVSDKIGDEDGEN